MSLILDTNVVSELRKAISGRADSAVMAWAKVTPAVSQFLSAVTVMELERGILSLGSRDPATAAILRAWLDNDVLVSFADRILPFDAIVARRCAALHVPRTRPERDAMIAATALVHGMAVATRNTGDFEGMGVRLIDPWRDGV